MIKKIFVIDDHRLFRNGLIRILKDHNDMEIVGQADSLKEAIELGSLDTTDILLLDLSLSGESSLEHIRRLKKMYPNLQILILTMHNKPLLIKRAINLDVDGYLVKESSPEILLMAIRQVSLGNKFLDTALSANLFQCVSEGAVSGEAQSGDYNTLSKREQEIFRLFAEGFRGDQIAKKLFISKKTVENHRYNVMRNLNIDTLQQLIAMADELGVI